MKTIELTISNINRNRKFGLGYSFEPTGQGTQIAAPKIPQYTGTIKQIREQLADEGQFHNAFQNTYQRWAFFYDGKRIESAFVFCVDYEDCRCEAECTCEPNCYDGWRSLAMSDLWDEINDRPERGDLKIRVIEEN